MANTTLNDRALIRLSGEDVRGFLQGLVTNDVSGNLPVWAALLTPQGRLRAPSWRGWRPDLSASDVRWEGAGALPTP